MFKIDMILEHIKKFDGPKMKLLGSELRYGIEKELLKLDVEKSLFYIFANHYLPVIINEQIEDLPFELQYIYFDSCCVLGPNRTWTLLREVFPPQHKFTSIDYRFLNHLASYSAPMIKRSFGVKLMMDYSQLAARMKRPDLLLNRFLEAYDME